jgi:AsmA protein
LYLPQCGFAPWNVEMRALKIAGAALAVLIVAVIALLTIGIPSSLVTSAIQARVERETGYRIAIAGAIRLGVWPSLNVTLRDVSLVDPKDREVSDRLTIDSVQAYFPLQSLLSDHPQIGELTIVRPVLHLPLIRERSRHIDRPARTSSSSGTKGGKVLPLDHVTITGGTMVFSNLQDRVENRIDGINADATAGADRQIDVAGSAETGEHALKFAIKATVPASFGERQNVPVELVLEAPGLLRQSISAKAEVRLNGPLVTLNGISGTFGDGQFNGWASADLASKPLIKLDLDFQRLAVGTSAREIGAAAEPQRAVQPWSDEKINLSALNYIDAEMRISAAEINIGDTRLAPAEVEAALGTGVLKATFSHLGVYGGQADGELGIDATTNNPAYTLRGDLTDVSALPLLSNLLDFDKLDGKMQTKISVRATGDSQRAMLSSLDGSMFVNFRDGAVHGINVARMIRTLTSGTLSGWQTDKDEATDLSQLGASFRIERGQATTGDLMLSGPLVRMSGAGTVDLATKSLAFRVEPKLVMTIQGQGGAPDPIGFGVPVVVQGPWSAPGIYPDMAGILDNPDAAYAKLRAMGQGLFGIGGAGTAAGTGSSQLGDTLGTLIQQGLGAASRAHTPQQQPQTQQPQATPATPDEQSPMNGILKQLFGR